MTPDFAGQRVTGISLDFMLRIFTDAGWQFDLEGDVELRALGKPPLRVDKHGPETAAPAEVASIEGQRISAVHVSEAGALHVVFPETELTVRPDPHYESWQIYGPNGEIIVCGPGGGLTTWGPRTE